MDHSFIDPITNLLYVSTGGGGLSVIDLDNEYSPYTKYTNTLKSHVTAWETLTPLTTARIAPAHGTIQDKIYCRRYKDWTDQATVEEYDPETDNWTMKEPLSEPRVTPASVVVDDLLYVIGGRDENWEPLDTVEVYDPLLDSWDTLSPMPTARIGPVAVEHDGKIYVLGGSTESSGDAIETVEIYTIATDSWETGTSMPEIRGSGHVAEVINGKIYVAGGLIGTSIFEAKQILIYDIAHDSWEYGAYAPRTILGASSVVWNDVLVVIGGTDASYDPTNNVLIYNPTTDGWYKPFDLPTPRHRSGAVLANGDLYVIGGKDENWNTADNVYRLASTTFSDLSLVQHPQALTWEDTTPSDTDIEMFYSLDGGTTYDSLGTTPGTYPITGEGTYSLRYKAKLTTDDESVTPSLESVTYTYGVGSTGEYLTTGTYTSKNTNIGTSKLLSFSAATTTPVNTDIAFEYSLDSGDTWAPIAHTYTFPDNTITSTFAWRATLSTGDSTDTPVIHDVTLTYTALGGGGLRNPQTDTEEIEETTETEEETEAEATTTPETTEDTPQENTPPSEVYISPANMPAVSELITLLVALNIIPEDKADIARTFITTESNSGGDKGESTEATLTFQYPLEHGDINEDVYELQVFLNTHNFALSETGVGSQGAETTVFGDLTQNAVIRFQEYYRDDVLTPIGLTEGTGYVGEMTYKKMEEVN